MKLHLVHVFSLFIIYILTIELTWMQSISNPPCHIGIKILFKWCEQSDCKQKCTCLSQKDVCKQICEQPHCGLLNCTSTKNCFQSVLFHDEIGRPNVKKITSCSPSTQQDCSRGKCELMAAYKYKGKFTRAFQSCSEGSCKHLYSEADYTNQFCGHCAKMTCTGKHAKNCTQLCVLDKCKHMYCNAKHCVQVCFKNSKCNLSCGPNVETCDQTCSHGSTCVMNCNAKVCRQTCNKEKTCIIKNKGTTQKPVVTKIIANNNYTQTTEISVLAGVIYTNHTLTTGTPMIIKKTITNKYEITVANTMIKRTKGLSTLKYNISTTNLIHNNNRSITNITVHRMSTATTNKQTMSKVVASASNRTIITPLHTTPYHLDEETSSSMVTTEKTLEVLRFNIQSSSSCSHCYVQFHLLPVFITLCLFYTV